MLWSSSLVSRLSVSLSNPQSETCASALVYLSEMRRGRLLARIGEDTMAAEVSRR